MTGSSTLDLQHRTLINNINHLEDMLLTTNPTRAECEFVIHLVEFLERYADTHFNLEEDCMERYRCPVHKKQRSPRTVPIFFQAIQGALPSGRFPPGNPPGSA